jgi:hypothetical protein
MSIPIIFPDSPTLSAATNASTPKPEPKSTTTSPTWIFAAM